MSEPEVGILCDIFKQILLACREIVLASKFHFHPQHGMTFMNIDAYDQLMIDGVLSIPNFEWYQIQEPIECTYYIEGLLRYIAKYVKDSEECVLNIFPRTGFIRVMHYQSKQILYSFDPRPLMRSVQFRPEQIALFAPASHYDRMGLPECLYMDYADWLVEVQKTLVKQILSPALVDDYMIHVGMLLPCNRKTTKSDNKTSNNKKLLTAEECENLIKTRNVLFSYANGHDRISREIGSTYIPFYDENEEEQHRRKIIQHGFSFEIRHKHSQQHSKLRGNGYAIEAGQVRDMTYHSFMLRHFTQIFNGIKAFDHRKNKMDWIGLSPKYGFLYVLPILFHGVSTEDQFNRLTQDRVSQAPSFIRFRLTHIPNKIRAVVRDDLYSPSFFL